MGHLVHTKLQVFGGEASSIGEVKRLPVTSWTQFVKEILGHPAVLNVTRSQFHAMNPKERNAAKRVRYVTPAWFKTSPSHRAYDKVGGISFVILDIDDPEQARKLTPEVVRTALNPYAFAVYTTASSTEEKPKLRVIVPAVPGFPAKAYPAAINRLASLLGLKNVTSESRVSVQPMYLPTIFRDEDPIDHHPLLVSILEGSHIASGEDVEMDTASRAEGIDDISDGIEYLRAPMEGVTPEDARDALTKLSPDCSMAEWIEMGAALKHQFGEQGFAIWDHWSEQGKKYDGEESIKKRWGHIRPTPRGRAPITIRTLFFRAELAGWKGMVGLQNKIYIQTVDWLKSSARTENELTKDGLLRIAACDVKSATSKAALLSHLQHSFRRLGVHISGSALRKALTKLEHKDGQARKAMDEAEVPKWARGIVYIQGMDEFYNRLGATALRPEVLDRTYGRKLMARDDDGSRAAVKPSDFLLNNVQIPIAKHYVYDPSHPEDTFVERDGGKYLNTYLPSYPESDPKGSAEAQEIVEGHLSNLIAESEYRRTALDFLSYIVQHPGKKIRWAFLLQGAPGCGKTALIEMMTTVLGAGNARNIGADLLFTPYNPWATGSQLVGFEEIRIVGHNRHEVMNRLKPCITNDTVSINRKYSDLQHVQNITNYIMFTNHHDSLAVSREDRRYFVVNSAFQTKAEVESKLGKQYFDRLFGCFKNNAGGLRHWLENRRISPAFAANGQAPVTRYLLDLVGAAATPLTASIQEAIQDGDDPLVRSDLLSTRSLKLAMASENLPRYSDQQLAVALRELDYIQVTRVRLKDGERHVLWGKRGLKLSATAAEQRAKLRANGKEDLV